MGIGDSQTSSIGLSVKIVHGSSKFLSGTHILAQKYCM
ncbi:unnamed protein product [Larinioides sclopetarius]|uniref:Uncharacterized protein n=1 Tax=Larinioides sclopetarius TaxID=280406 RepID=A0AAV1ZQ07_9ARAC